MGITITVDNNGEKTTFISDERQFKSGNKGYLSNGVALINGKKYRCNLRLIEMVPRIKVIQGPSVSIDGGSINSNTTIQ